MTTNLTIDFSVSVRWVSENSWPRPLAGFSFDRSGISGSTLKIQPPENMLLPMARAPISSISGASKAMTSRGHCMADAQVRAARQGQAFGDDVFEPQAEARRRRRGTAW